MDKTLMIGLLLGFTVLIVLSALILNKQKKCNSENYSDDDWVLVKHFTAGGAFLPIRVSNSLRNSGGSFDGIYTELSMNKPLKITLQNMGGKNGSGTISIGGSNSSINWERNDVGPNMPYIYLGQNDLVLTKGIVIDATLNKFNIAFPDAKQDLCS